MCCEEQRRNLVVTARDEAERLNRLVGNLLSMTRIESGAIQLHREPGDMEDVIGTALEQLGKRVAGHEVRVSVPRDFPLVQMDFSLVVQVVVNLLENAVKYSAAGSPIEVTASLVGGNARLEVADRGVGIPAEDLAGYSTSSTGCSVRVRGQHGSGTSISKGSWRHITGASARAAGRAVELS
jgi:two-component system sensor histidine kinase KdpD